MPTQIASHPPDIALLSAGHIPLLAHGPKLRFMKPQDGLGLLSSKEQVSLVLLKRWKLESWALTFLRTTRQSCPQRPLLSLAKEHENRPPFLGAMGRKRRRCPLSGSVETTRMEYVVLSGQARARHGARQEDTVDIDAESIVPPSPSLPAHLCGRDQAQGQAFCFRPSCLLRLTQTHTSTSPGPGRSGMIRFIPELVQRQEPVWHERYLAHSSMWENICLFSGSGEDLRTWAGAGAGCSPSLVYIL